MTTGPRRSDIGIFSIDDRSCQVIWRGLPVGRLDLSTTDEDGRVRSRMTVEITTADEPGAVELGDLPPSTALVLDATHSSAPPVRTAFRTFDLLPGEELSRVATISDLHLGARAFGHRKTIVETPRPEVPHPERCTVAAIADLTKWGASHLSVKGDVTESGRIEQWRTYDRIIGTVAMPVDALPGNHDAEHPTSGPGNLDSTAAAAMFGFSMADPLTVRDLPGLRIVLANTCTPGKNSGTLAAIGGDILDACAEADPTAAVIVMLHHQLHPRTGQEGWPVGIAHAESVDFMENLSRVHPRTLVTSGHSHRHRRWEHAGITTTQVGSVKDYPGTWAGYTVTEGGLRQTVRRVNQPDCLRWTDQTRRGAMGAWRFIGPGPFTSRCFDLVWN